MKKVEKQLPHSAIKPMFETVDEYFEGSEKLRFIVSDHIHHFMIEKWPIAVDHVVSEMFRELTGADPVLYFAKMLAKNGIPVGLGTADVGSVFYLEPKRKKKTTKKKVKKKGKKK